MYYNTYPNHAKALETGAKARHVKDRRVPFDRTQRIKERKERLALVQKRAPGKFHG